MTRRTINRSALLTWSPSFEKKPLVACGTTSFLENNGLYNNSKLELFDLSDEQPTEILSISVPSIFNRILWTSVEAYSKNLLVGAFKDGRIEVYNVEMLLNAEPDVIVEVPKLHSGAVKGLCVSSFQPNLIASGATNAEIALWDLDNINKASLINVKKSELFSNNSDLAWNPKVAHILAAASDSGVVSIIDLRSKKEVTSLSLPNFASVSSIAWNPETPTSIVSSTNDDNSPFAYLWDLRAAKTPKNIFDGHSKGISSLSWCRDDVKMILSTGKDGKSLCWNPESNQIIREYSDDEEGFDIKFCPSNPNIFCISHCNFIEFRSITDDASSSKNISSCKASDEAPKWLNCPNGTFFGGNNICPTFRSESRDIYLLKPKIDFFSSLFDDLVEFENTINHESAQNACDLIIDTQSNKDEIIIGKLLKHYACFKIDLDIVKLAENLNDIFESKSTNHENIEDKINNLNIEDKINNSKIDYTSKFKDFENDICDKIIESDFEGAVNECLNASRYVDALIISNCGGTDLRSKVENFILKNNNSFHINLTIHLGRNDLHGFISTAPLSEWISIIKVILKNSNPEYVPQFAKVLSKRLIIENMHYPALFTSLLAQDFEYFAESVFNLKLGDKNPSISELIYLFKIIRTIEAFKPDSIKSFENYSTRLKVFEIISKLLSLFLSAGLSANFIVNLLDSDFYENHVKDKNSDIDSFFGFIQPTQSNPVEERSDLKANFSNGAYVNSFSHKNSNSKEFVPNYVSPKPVFIHKHATPSSPSNNINYNDAPIVNPKLSKFSPQICNQEISPEDVLLALKSLSDSIEMKTLPESQVRIVQECFKKLNAQVICSKAYSDLSKACIASLLKELSSFNFDLSATLAANILASFFTETKEWILPLKRLIEIAKN